MHRDRVLLVLYLAAVIALTTIHDPRALAAGFVLVLVLAGRDAPGLLRRALRMVAVFALVTSVAYAVTAWLHQQDPWLSLLRLNLRVTALAVLIFLFMARVNLFRALDFSPPLTYLLGLAYSQALTFRRVHEEFQQALASRSIERPRLRDRYRVSAAAVAWLLDKGFSSARESALALRARGLL